MKTLISQKKQFKHGSFSYGYALIRQDRQTLSLTVEPDMAIYVKSPHKASEERIELFLKRKWLWLEKQLAFFGKYQGKQYQREYISGESFYYLGRQHQLVVKRAMENKVIRSRNILLVETTNSVSDGLYNKKIVSRWLDENTPVVLGQRFKEMQERFDYKTMPGLVVRNMVRRWGSFVDKNKIIINPKIIHASKECIDYVIVHELCHVRFKNHDKKFFKLLDEKYPKWEKIKDKLEVMGTTC